MFGIKGDTIMENDVKNFLENDITQEDIDQIAIAYENTPNLYTATKVPLTPKEFVELIREFYDDARKIPLSRYDLKWAKWSVTMNDELRGRIMSKKDPEELKLKYVIVYWTLKSQLLELCFKYPRFKLSQKKKVAKEARKIRMIIESADGLHVPAIESKDIMEIVLRGFK